MFFHPDCDVAALVDFQEDAARTYGVRHAGRNKNDVAGFYIDLMQALQHRFYVLRFHPLFPQGRVTCGLKPA